MDTSFNECGLQGGKPIYTNKEYSTNKNSNKPFSIYKKKYLCLFDVEHSIQNSIEKGADLFT